LWWSVSTVIGRWFLALGILISLNKLLVSARSITWKLKRLLVTNVTF
jgi:hypothetical protein